VIEVKRLGAMTTEVSALAEAAARAVTVLEADSEALLARRTQFDREVEETRADLSAKEFEVLRAANELRREQEAWRASRTRAVEAEAGQQTRLHLIAGGATFVTTAQVLMQRESDSGLAMLVKKLVDDATKSGDATAAAFFGDGPPPGQLELVLNRDAATISSLLAWLGDGEAAIEELAPAALRRLRLEAAHWGMLTLEHQCAARANATTSDTDEARHVAAQVLQIGCSPAAPVCRVLLSDLRLWLCKCQSRRDAACEGPSQIIGSLADALETHHTDASVARHGIGCCSLLGASCATARRQLTEQQTRLEAIVDRAVRLAKEDSAWRKAGEEAHLLRRVLKLGRRDDCDEIAARTQRQNPERAGPGYFNAKVR